MDNMGKKMYNLSMMVSPETGNVDALSFAQAEQIASRVGLRGVGLAVFLGISPKTFGRRRQQGWLEGGEVLRLGMLEQMYNLACEVLGSEERAQFWLTRPLAGLGGKAPVEMLTHIRGYETVRNALYRQAHGMF
jgi:putative toxin-antitoxin system antitoxin component (TIGR02293 family)